MKRFTTNDEIENLCEAMIKDFFKSKHYTNVMCVDIEAFVQEYLGVPIVYETFAEPDPGRVGFLSDGKRPLLVRRGNKVEQVVFPARTAVIEKYLLNQKESARRRFSIMLKEMLSINECFTNRAAACFLMPAFLVARVLKRHNNSKKVILYDDGILSQDQKLLIQKMADTLGVSFTAFHTRLSELDLFERRPVEEYLHEGLRYGGELHAGSN